MEPQINTDEHRSALNAISARIIGCAYAVSNTLGCGFLEKVYENALAHALRKEGLAVEQQRSLRVEYDGVVVGDYIADMVVEDRVLVEVKAVRSLDEVHLAQCMNYLKATDMRLCLLMNFGAPKVTVKRIIND
jgi:GxxExxY protein